MSERTSEETPKVASGCVIKIIRNWMTVEIADYLLKRIQEEIPMSLFERTSYGKVYKVPRRMFKFGNREVASIDENGVPMGTPGYKYSPKDALGYPIYIWDTPRNVLCKGIPTSDWYENPIDQRVYRPTDQYDHTIPVGKIIEGIMKRINETGLNFNSVLINEYESGNQKIDKHSDREALGKGNAVYGISLGGTRDFYFHGINGTKAEGDRIRLKSVHGDLMVMYGDTQKCYVHEVPKRAKADYRVSLTFRHL